MKKIIGVFLAGFLALCLSACSSGFGVNNFNANENPPMRISAADWIQ